VNEGAFRRVVAVIGGRDAGPDILKEAERLGGLLAKRGWVVLTGGLGGVMEAASKGAFEEGGITVGILPQDHPEEANPYVMIPVCTGLGIGRNVIIVRSAEVVFAVGGGYGTLSEIAYALQMGKPVIGIRTWDIPGLIPAGDARDALDRAEELSGHLSRRSSE